MLWPLALIRDHNWWGHFHQKWNHSFGNIPSYWVFGWQSCKFDIFCGSPNCSSWWCCWWHLLVKIPMILVINVRTCFNQTSLMRVRCQERGWTLQRAAFTTTSSFRSSTSFSSPSSSLCPFIQKSQQNYLHHLWIYPRPRPYHPLWLNPSSLILF